MGLRETTVLRPLDEADLLRLAQGVETYGAFAQFDAGQSATLHLSEEDAQQEASKFADLLRDKAVELEKTWDMLLPASVQDIGLSFSIGFGIEIRYDWEVRKEFVKERGAVVAGQTYQTEIYGYDGYISQEGKDLSDITSNALGSITIPGLGQTRTGAGGGIIRSGPRPRPASRTCRMPSRSSRPVPWLRKQTSRSYRFLTVGMMLSSGQPTCSCRKACSCPDKRRSPCATRERIWLAGRKT